MFDEISVFDRWTAHKHNEQAQLWNKVSSVASCDPEPRVCRSLTVLILLRRLWEVSRCSSRFRRTRSSSDVLPPLARFIGLYDTLTPRDHWWEPVRQQIQSVLGVKEVSSASLRRRRVASSSSPADQFSFTYQPTSTTTLTHAATLPKVVYVSRFVLPLLSRHSRPDLTLAADRSPSLVLSGNLPGIESSSRKITIY